MADAVNGASAGYAYDRLGNVQSMVYGNGVTNAYQYDALNRLTNLVWQAGSAARAKFAYQLDLTGNRTNSTETVNGTSQVNAWSFDSIYRLTNEVAGSLASLAYQYDVVGNRLSRNSTFSGLTNQTFTFNTNDWLSSDKYDGDGNTTNSWNNAYQYDPANEVTNVNNAISLVYDGDGSRVMKQVGTTTTYYVVDDQNPSGYPQVLEELVDSGNGYGPQPAKTYTYGLALVSQQPFSAGTLGTLSYYGYDGHGSVRFLMNSSGGITDTYAYDAFGNIISHSGSTSNNYLYCAQQWDPDLGLYYNRARYLNPNACRFWTSDQTDGDNEDPLSLHKYLYGADNPVNEIDPLGQSFFGFDGTGNSPTANLSNIRKMWFGSTDPDKHYEVGVGTAWGTRTFAGATGLGMARRESKAMGELIADRAKGDTVVDIVGFSRGGIEATEFANRVADAFPDETIRFVGLFDPVGSVGHPGGFGSYRSQLPSSVQYSVEAMAANENRSFFPATDVNVNLQQWFRGTHSDIGGGWPNHQLSDYVLQWMIQQAQSKGVGINLSAIQAKYGWDPDPNAAIDSNQGFTSWFTTGSVRNVLSATGGGYTVSPSDMGF